MDAAFDRALHGVAGQLQVLASESGIYQLYEADLRAAVRRSLHIETGRSVIPEEPLPLTSWKGTGGVDIAVSTATGKGYEAIAELKLWKELKKIDEALWDAWKLGSAYKEGLASYAYLIAAGPESYWSSDRRALCFFGEGTWRTGEFFPLWQSWVTRTSGPIELPAGIRTRLISTVPIHLAQGEPWRIRCARVTTLPGRAFIVPTVP